MSEAVKAHRRLTPRFLLAGALSVTLGVASGCGSSTKPPETFSGSGSQKTVPHHAGEILCRALSPDTWQPAAGNVNADAVARALGVSDAQVLDGKIGAASCDPPIAADTVLASGVKVLVEGIDESPDCLVIGVFSGPAPPQPGYSYSKVHAVCAAPSAMAI